MRSCPASYSHNTQPRGCRLRLCTYLGEVRRTLRRRSSGRRVDLHRAGSMEQDFSGSCIVTSRNSLIHDGATTATKSERFDAEGVPPCCCRGVGTAPDGFLATLNFAEFHFPRTPVDRVVRGGPNVRTDASSVVEHAFGDPQCQFFLQILEVPLPTLVCVVADPEHYRILVWEPCQNAEGPAIPAVAPDDPSLVGGRDHPTVTVVAVAAFFLEHVGLEHLVLGALAQDL